MTLSKDIVHTLRIVFNIGLGWWALCVKCGVQCGAMYVVLSVVQKKCVRNKSTVCGEATHARRTSREMCVSIPGAIIGITLSRKTFKVSGLLQLAKICGSVPNFASY